MKTLISFSRDFTTVYGHLEQNLHKRVKNCNASAWEQNGEKRIKTPCRGVLEWRVSESLEITELS